MPNTEVYLIRHGLPAYEFDSEGRKLMYSPQVKLSEEGRLQAEALSKKLPKLDVIYTSPFIRTKETAGIIAHNLGVNSMIDSDTLVDIYSLNYEGQLLQDVLDEKVERHPDDESTADAYVRITNGFKTILEKEKGKKVGIVSHGHPIRYIVWENVERGEPIQKNTKELVAKNYAQQGEAWVLIFNKLGELTNSYLLSRDDNLEPGVGKW